MKRIFTRKTLLNYKMSTVNNISFQQQLLKLLIENKGLRLVKTLFQYQYQDNSIIVLKCFKTYQYFFKVVLLHKNNFKKIKI